MGGRSHLFTQIHYDEHLCSVCVIAVDGVCEHESATIPNEKIAIDTDNEETDK
jgi:hypothetical protein